MKKITMNSIIPVDRIIEKKIVTDSYYDYYDDGNNIKVDHTCFICKGILIDPVKCFNCVENMCFDCHKKELTKNKSPESKSNNFNNTCPHTKILKDKRIDHQLNDLKLECLECKGIFKYADYLEHIELKCEKIDYKKKYLELYNEMKEIKLIRNFVLTNECEDEKLKDYFKELLTNSKIIKELQVYKVMEENYHSIAEDYYKLSKKCNFGIENDDKLYEERLVNLEKRLNLLQVKTMNSYPEYGINYYLNAFKKFEFEEAYKKKYEKEKEIINKNVIKTLRHPHKMLDSKKLWECYCNCCLKHYKIGEMMFYCPDCDFDLCHKCYENEKKEVERRVTRQINEMIEENKLYNKFNF